MFACPSLCFILCPYKYQTTRSCVFLSSVSSVICNVIIIRTSEVGVIFWCGLPFYSDIYREYVFPPRNCLLVSIRASNQACTFVPQLATYCKGFLRFSAAILTACRRHDTSSCHGSIRRCLSNLRRVV